MSNGRVEDIERDDKDWTWTIASRCPECGFDARVVGAAEVADQLRRLGQGWPTALADSAAAERPRPGVWSPVEYACHVRDVSRLFTERTRLMLTETDPVFPDWDGDAAAQGYAASEPATVAAEVVAAIGAYAAAHDGLADTDWERGGARGDGVPFTVLSLARYGLHEVAHHLWDVTRPTTDQ